MRILLILPFLALPLLGECFVESFTAPSLAVVRYYPFQAASLPSISCNTFAVTATHDHTTDTNATVDTKLTANKNTNAKSASQRKFGHYRSKRRRNSNSKEEKEFQNMSFYDFQKYTSDVCSMQLGQMVNDDINNIEQLVQHLLLLEKLFNTWKIKFKNGKGGKKRTCVRMIDKVFVKILETLEKIDPIEDILTSNSKTVSFDLLGMLSLLLNQYKFANNEADRAYSMLMRAQKYPSLSSLLTIEHYNAVLEAHARSPGRYSAWAAQGLLDSLIADCLAKEEAAKVTGGERVLENIIVPNQRSFNVVINAWAKSGYDSNKVDNNDLIGDKAQNVLKQMEQFSKKGHEEVKSDRFSYNTVVHALAKSNGPDAYDSAKEVVNQMIEAGIEPDVVTYSSLLMTLESSSPKNVVLLADEVLNSIRTEPDLGIYNTYLHIVSKAQKGADERVLKIVDKMERDPKLKPDLITYNILLKTVARVDRNGERAESMLEKISANPNLKPDIVSYNSVINGYAKCRTAESALKAEKVLIRMKELDVKPDRLTYNTMIDAWSQIGDASNAERILLQMEEAALFGSPWLKPNVTSYNHLLSAWMRSSREESVNRSKELLGHMIEQGVEPDIYSYNSVMNCIAKSKEENKAQKVYALYEEVKRLYTSMGKITLKPNVVTYSTVINACAYTINSEEKRKALDIAMRSFDELQDSTTAYTNHVTYGAIFQCIGNLLPVENENRRPLIEKIWDQCKADGQVGPITLSGLKLACKSTDMFASFIGKQVHGKTFVTVDDLPNEWTRNVRDSKKPSVPSFRKSKRPRM